VTTTSIDITLRRVSAEPRTEGDERSVFGVVTDPNETTLDSSPVGVMVAVRGDLERLSAGEAQALNQLFHVSHDAAQCLARRILGLDIVIARREGDDG
jgi:hypothetical protein